MYLLNPDKTTYTKIYDYSIEGIPFKASTSNSYTNSYPITVSERLYSQKAIRVPLPPRVTSLGVDGFVSQGQFYNGFMLPLTSIDNENGYAKAGPYTNYSSAFSAKVNFSYIGSLDINDSVPLANNLTDRRNIFTNSNTNATYDDDITYYLWFSQNCLTNSASAKLNNILPLQNNGDVSFITSGFITLSSV